MQKSVMERFIAKYNLAGAAEAVLWSTEDKQLSTKFISEDKNVLGLVSTTEATFSPEGEYGIFDTAQLRSLLGVLDDDIQVKVNSYGEKMVSLGLRDSQTKVTFMLSEPTVIPDVPNLKSLPDFDLTVKLDDKFINTFVRGKNALPEIETFTALEEDGEHRVVLGYSPTLNSTRVTLNVETTKNSGELSRAISFSARYLKDILLANKEAKGGLMRVSEKGIAHVTFEVDGFSVDYYLVEIKLA